MSIFTFTTRVMREDIIGRGRQIHPDDATAFEVRTAALAEAEKRAIGMGWTVEGLESFEEFVPHDRVAARVALICQKVEEG